MMTRTIAVAWSDYNDDVASCCSCPLEAVRWWYNLGSSGDGGLHPPAASIVVVVVAMMMEGVSPFLLGDAVLHSCPSERSTHTSNTCKP